MAKTSTSGSPGVEVYEDFSQTVRVSDTTVSTLYLQGFASQGPVEEVNNIGEISDFTNMYGEPTNAAERYFYYSVKAALDNTPAGTTIMTSRLPYGYGKGDNVTTAYTLLSYPAIPVVKNPINDKGFDHLKLNADDSVIKEFFKLRAVNSSGGFAEAKSVQATIIAPNEKFAQAALIKLISVKSEALPPFNPQVVGETPQAFLKYSINGVSNTDNGGSEDEYNVRFTVKKDADANSNKVYVSMACVARPTQNTDLVSPLASIVFDITYDDEVLSEHPEAFAFTPPAETGEPISLKGVKAFITATDYNGTIPTEDYRLITPEIRESDYFKANFTDNGSSCQAKDVTYLVGTPSTFHVSIDEYYSIISGEAFDWSSTPATFKGIEAGVEGAPKGEFGWYKNLANSAFILLNTNRGIVNDKFEGQYIGITDNMFVSPSDDYTYNAVSSVKITTATSADKSNPALDRKEGRGLLDNIYGTGDFDKLSTLRMGFQTEGNGAGTISRILARSCSSIDTSTSEYDDTLSIALFKLNNSTTEAQTMKLVYTTRERYNTAFGKTRMKTTSNATTPVSFFVENIVSESSNNIGIMVNDFVAGKIKLDTEGLLRGKVRVFGTKLIDNLDNYEGKYTVGDLAKKLDDSTNPVGLAKTFASSYAKMIAQAGVSPQYLHGSFLCSTDEAVDTKPDYKTFQKCDAIYPVGTYSTLLNTSKIVGDVPYKLERSLQLVENDEEYPDCDLIPDCGLSTIYAYSNGNALVGESIQQLPDIANQFSGEDDESLQKQTNFVDTIILQGIEDMRTGRATLTEDAEKVIEDWKAVQNVFFSFCNSQTNGGRGDAFYLPDLLRGIFIKGKNTKVERLYGTKLKNNAYTEAETINHSFSTSIYYPMKHLTENVVSSYGGMFAQWFKINDVFTGEKIWMPASARIAADFAATDVDYGPWYATAGMRRGVINDVLDIAFNPSQKQRTDLYKLCINSIPQMPGSGITIYGVRTMSKQECVFDQIPCRRTFLYIEKKLKGFLRYYLFEPNTSYTRLAIYNDIFPFMEKLRNQEAIYSFTITCDDSNNTPDVIDNGDLVVDVAAAPVRTAENIILNAIAQKYKQTTTIESSM